MHDVCRTLLATPRAPLYNRSSPLVPIPPDVPCHGHRDVGRLDHYNPPIVTAALYALLQVQPARDTLAVVSEVAGIVIAAAMLILVFLAGLLFVRINRLLGEIRLGVRQNLGPVSDRARSISDNVEFITQALRSDVEQLSGSVKALTGRLHLASERMEERIEDFNALMEVVQGEAEDVFLDTASAVRGVRAGARTLSEGLRASDPENRADDDQGPEPDKNALRDAPEANAFAGEEG